MSATSLKEPSWCAFVELIKLLVCSAELLDVQPLVQLREIFSVDQLAVLAYGAQQALPLTETKRKIS